MGCVPSRELHESPESLYFFHSGSLQLARVPLTPHFFPSSDCLGFRQLYDCRNSQSAKYGFALFGPSFWYKEGAASEGQRCAVVMDDGTLDSSSDNDNGAWDDVCEEEREPNPSVGCRVDNSLMLQAHDEGGSHRLGSPDDDEGTGDYSDTGDSYFFREPADLYRVLVTHGAVPAITDTNAEMQALYEEERAWLRAREVIRQHRRCLLEQVKGDTRKKYCTNDASSATANAEASLLRRAELVPPPRRFLWALPSAVVVVLTSDKVTQEANLCDTAVPRDGALHLLECDGLLFLVSCLHDGTYILPPTPVRVVGCDSLFPARCRGTPWLRGTENDLEEDEYIESLPPSQRPPVLCACRFCVSDVCEKAFSRACLAALGDYARLSRMAKMDEMITRPLWYLGIASNVPMLRMCAEFRQLVQETPFPNAAMVSVRRNRLLLRVQERAVRAVCSFCARTGCGTQQLLCQRIQPTLFRPVAYDYGGRVGVHMKSGKLCVPARTLALLQKSHRDSGLQELRGAGCSEAVLVFVVTIPWKTAAHNNGTSIDTFRDGDLVVYDDAHRHWTRLMTSAVMLEEVLLHWINKIISEATFRHEDSEWLRDGRRCIVREGRFHIWSVLHDGLPYFFGIMPKFSKELRKRQMLQERKKQIYKERMEQQQQQQKFHITTILPVGRHDQSANGATATSRRYGDAANYFRNGCFTWNPYGRRG